MQLLTTAIVALTLTHAGSTQADAVPEYTRERTRELCDLVRKSKYDLYVALLHLASDDPAKVAKGEQMILRRIEIKRTHIAFFYMDVVLAYRLFKDKLSPDGRERIAAAILDLIKPGSFKYGCRFVHANDNWPFNAASIMILGGEEIGRTDLALEGVIRLESYLKMSRQIGVASEYNSPTYNALSLYAVEAVAGLARSLRARVVARVVAERLWSENALRFHRPTGLLAAPHSRAYFHDTLGVRSAMLYTLHPLLPSGARLDDDGFPKVRECTQSVAENSLIRRFFSPHLAAMCEKKPFPYLVKARKFRPFRQEGKDMWPGGFFDTVTYLTATYAVGSAGRTFCGGHATTPFQAHWDTGAGRANTLFTRYRVDDAFPDTEKRIEQFYEDGYIHPVQHRSTTIVLYRPKLQWKQSKDKQATPPTSLAASAVVPHPERLEGVYVGTDARPVKQWPLVLAKPQLVFLRDGAAYVALHPLAVTDIGRQHAMRMVRRPKFLVVSLYNLQSDKPTPIDEAALLSTRNGFVVELGDEVEFGSFKAFVAKVGQAVVEDAVADGVRTVRYERPGRSMVVSQRVATHQYLSRQFDGKQYVGPMLASPHMAATLDKELTVGDATLSSAPGESKFLTAEPTTGTYVVLYPFRWPFPVHLKTPKGSVHCDGFRMGRILYRPSDHTRLGIDCARAPLPLRFTKPRGNFTVIVNDQDVTAAVKPVADGLLEVTLPGNDRPKAMHARLDVRVETDLAELGNKGRGSMFATVHNVSDTPALDIMAVPFIEGFIRHYGCGVRTIDQLVPNASQRLSWGLTGTPAGKHAAFRVAAGAVNAPRVIRAAR